MSIVPAEETRTPAKVVGGIPYFQEYLALANAISKTAMVPGPLRNRPEEVLAVMMYGAELGIGPMQALQQINFIAGKPSAAAELLRALVLEAGHKFIINSTREVATARCKRKDWDEYEETTFTIQDAQLAGVANGDNWKKYPDQMLSARVTSKACRMWFADVIAGMSYVPEEIESFSPPTESKPVKAAKAPTTVTRSAPIQTHEDDASEEEVEHLKRLLAMLEDADKDEVKATWKSLGLPALTHGLTDDQCDQATQMVIEVLNRLAPVIVDAEEVEPQDDHTAPVETVPASTIGVPKMTQPMIGKVRALLGNRDDLHEVVSEKIGRQIESLKDVTKSEGMKLIDQLVADADAL